MKSLPPSLLSPELIQDVLDALPAPVFVKDRHGLYLGCNRAFSTLVGKRPDEIAGKSVFNLWEPDLAKIYFDADEALMASGKMQQYEAQVITQSGERRDVLFYKALLSDATGSITGMVGTILDITERKTLERTLTALAEHDALTGLLNRRAIFDYMQRMSDPRPVAVLMCDLDHFKAINDAHGHFGGDEVLRTTARLLQAQLREEDRLARVGGEEFLIILHNADAGIALQVAERLLAAVSHAQIMYEGRRIDVSLSLGAAVGHAAGGAAVGLVRIADDRLYRAKREGRGRIVMSD
ncbi:diguanylate cyclase [Uliginosibacterium paludis]|uniref:Diguanylate cyclase n=1 Tax=Uliginosibacterium paludis TaxID=1615952 RepID=A0ABV2CRQ2_9RHOO